MICWSCGQEAEEVHFCRKCGSLQKPSSDYFSCLGLPQKLQLDRQEMEKRFYGLSRRLHPDRYARRPEAERRLAEEATARLNDAYRTLKDPVARAEYLLELHGLVKSEQKTQVSPGFYHPAPAMGFYGWYSAAWVGYYEPPMVYQYDVVTSETSLYSPPQSRLVWSGMTETFAPQDVKKETRGFAKVIIGALREQGIIAP